MNEKMLKPTRIGALAGAGFQVASVMIDGGTNQELIEQVKNGAELQGIERTLCCAPGEFLPEGPERRAGSPNTMLPFDSVATSAEAFHTPFSGTFKGRIWSVEERKK